ncbi:TIGR04076 family protein [[Eubacterium] cellulosolvens]
MIDKTPYKVVVTLKEIKGTCAANKIGDKIEVIGDHIKGDLCSMALHAIYPYIFAFQHGANLWWLDNKDEILACCTDPANLAIFEIKRVKMEEQSEI